MKKNYALLILPVIMVLGITKISAQSQKKGVILYLNPEIYPPLEEISQPTFAAFSDAMSDLHSAGSLLRADVSENYENIDNQTIAEYAKNNDAEFVLVPKVKYFKVGIGRYILSNQVEVSMKLLDKNGKLLCESVYNTYKKNMRILGSAENSIKKGTKGAIKEIFAKIRETKRQDLN